MITVVYSSLRLLLGRAGSVLPQYVLAKAIEVPSAQTRANSTCPHSVGVLAAGVQHNGLGLQVPKRWRKCQDRMVLFASNKMRKAEQTLKITQSQTHSVIFMCSNRCAGQLLEIQINPPPLHHDVFPKDLCSFDHIDFRLEH